MIYPRKEEKSYGTERLIEGRFSAGQRVLLIDDVITSGGAKWESVAALQASGLTVEHVLVVVDRSRGAGDALRERGIRLLSLLTAEELMRALAARQRISPQQLDLALAYLREG